ncbi:hypothetical protein NHX12_023422 [Muraenolepis orangiensis]|uniref:Probable RNA-binding protein 18 n=1 Tax=Muraenolepis orangiensis TaxID=630683 RepID=A0A9Q0EKS1_9TELE|nr:hypothetical protein NHX12_023422 [Muraenolepis orangiensis]
MSSGSGSAVDASVVDASLSADPSTDGHRLWIGNLDPKISEYHLVKLLERFGSVRQFDFLFHKAGPMEGQPRGYCFVNFRSRIEAERAVRCLDGKLALSRRLVVRWAHAQRFEGFRTEKSGPPSGLEPGCGGPAEEGPACSSDGHLSTGAKIRAIEAKLLMMEQNPDQEPAGPPPYVYNPPPDRKRWEPYHRGGHSRPYRKFRR